MLMSQLCLRQLTLVEAENYHSYSYRGCRRYLGDFHSRDSCFEMILETVSRAYA